MAEKEYDSVRRYVDMWAMPGMHPSNVEFLQKLKTADTNHFNTHMDCVGSVSELNNESGDWEKTHLVGVRTDIWKPDDEELESAVCAMKSRRRKELKKGIKRSGRLNQKQSDRLEEAMADDEVMNLKCDEIETRRLVLKLFKTTSSRTRWVGTIEEVTATEVHNSIGSKRTLITMAVNMPRTSFVTYVQQNHRTFRIPAVYTFAFYDQEQLWNAMIKRQWLSVGADFDLEVNGETIGEVDGRLLSFGYDSYVEIDPHPLAENTQFVDLLTMFASTVGYHRAMRRSIKKRVDAALCGDTHCNIVHDEELRLRHNGRAAA
ncbi:MAG: hypothetical protein HKN47_28835 [Pirellulaceae bacterium]|nr:hypothetical protein [Pirellulaceae bacterium]